MLRAQKLEVQKDGELITKKNRCELLKDSHLSLVQAGDSAQ